MNEIYFFEIIAINKMYIVSRSAFIAIIIRITQHTVCHVVTERSLFIYIYKNVTVRLCVVFGDVKLRK
jgi:hypothetical protein